MKILVISQHYYPEQFKITDICEALVKMGHSVSVLTGLPNYPEGYIYESYKRGKNRRQTINGVDVIRAFTIGRRQNVLFRFLNYYSFSIAARFRAEKLGGEFDVVMAYQTSPVLMIRPAIAYQKKYNKKMLVYCLDLWPASLRAGGVKKSSLIYKLYFKISKKIYASADSLCAPFMTFFDYFKEELGLSDAAFRYIPQYAEDIFLDVRPSERQRGEGELNLVFAGNIGRAQSVETIIEAANILKSYQNIKWHIVGDGTSCNECVSLKEKYALDNVIFYGRRQLSEMNYFYSLADAMLLTLFKDETISYTLPGKTYTYMAAGKPILASADGETARVINESGCGLCCAAQDAKGLSETVLTFMNDADKAKYADASKAYYLKYFDKREVLLMLEHALHELI